MDKVYLPRDRVIYREIADEAILVPVQGDIADMRSLFSLNLVGRYIWLNLNGQRSVSDIVDGMCEHFDVERNQAEEDVRLFVDELLQADLIVGA
jgi:hypothetical protein